MREKGLNQKKLLVIGILGLLTAKDPLSESLKAWLFANSVGVYASIMFSIFVTLPLASL